MSFDLGVWYPHKRIGNKEARELYTRLCDGNRSGVVPHPAVDEFYAELTAKHPEIDTIPEEKIDDHDYCPWSCQLDHSPGHVIMSCVWSKATFVDRLVQSLARKHGLAIYDPQSDEVTYPDGRTGTRTSHGALWILGSFALLFAAIFVYSEHIAHSKAPLVSYTLAGLCGIMAAACFRQALR
jgi:predicted nucleic acid-binding protein